MKGIDTIKRILLVSISSFLLVGDISRKPLIELTKSANISCNSFSYVVIPDPFLDLRSSKMDQLKGIDAMKKMPGGNFFIHVGGGYLKKTSH